MTRLEVKWNWKKKYATHSKCLEYIKLFYEAQTYNNYPRYQRTFYNTKFKLTQQTRKNEINSQDWKMIFKWNKV